ncbi:glutamine amidotransferase class-I family protein [Metarhizium robertsii]|uniref:Glutamine amidotransferase class-I family protein n=1 Tax=Metarhizium robertsii TaxID=568076 RepID=A0A0A1V4S0_9HYPO|nr:glutamine amidotransferase class-I family protein [Metarhizium robertsii]
MPFRLAVLECDTPVPGVEKERGSYGAIFETLLSNGKSVDFRLLKYDVVRQHTYPSTGDVDGILITGSKHTAFADDAWIVQLVSYIRDVLNTSRTPVVGICFGHQVIARALGATTAVARGGWEVSVSSVDLSPDGRKLFGASSLMHRDEVASVPEGLVCLGSSARCPVQGMYKRKAVLSLQAHPEFDGFIMEQILRARRDQGIFGDDMFGEAVGRAGDAHDGTLVAGKIWDFFLDAVA